MQGGEGVNVILGGDGNDALRLRGRGANRVDAGAGDDTVHALTRRAATVDCGAGRDTVLFGRVRPRATGCETVISRYR